MSNICKFGDKCKFYSQGKCKFEHHTKQPTQPEIRMCRFGVNCRDISNCKFAHTEEAVVTIIGKKIFESLPQNTSTEQRMPNLTFRQFKEMQKHSRCCFGENCRDILNCDFAHTQKEIELAETEAMLKSWVQYYENYCNTTQFITIAQFANLVAPYENLSPSEIVELVETGIKILMPELDCDLDEESDEEDKFGDAFFGDDGYDEAFETYSDF